MAGAKPGHAVYEVDPTRIELPRGVRAVSRRPLPSRSISSAAVARRSARADLVGEVAADFALGGVEVDPPRVWLAGARGEVMRLVEVVTEPIDLTGLQAPFERKVRLLLANEHVWPEQDGPVTVRISIEPKPAPADERASRTSPPARAAGSR